MPPCLTLGIIRHVSRVKWNNPRKGVALSPTLGAVAIGKGAFGSPSTTIANFTYIYIYISGAETGLVLLVPGTTNNSVNVIQNGLKIIH